MGRRPRVSGPGAAPGQVFVTQRLSRLIENASREANRLKDEYVSVEHLVIALLDEGSSSAAGRLLQQHGLTRNGFLSALTEVRGHQRVMSATPEGTYEALDKYGRDLVAEAAAGRLEPVIGRDSEIRRTIQILSRKTKNNPVLIGEPGCWQDRHCRGTGAADQQRGCSLGSTRQDRLRSGPGCAGCGGEVSGRVRGAAQGRPQRGSERRRQDPALR